MQCIIKKGSKTNRWKSHPVYTLVYGNEYKKKDYPMETSMKKLSLSEIGNLAEAIAAAGVIISLIYLAVQIDQNKHLER